MLSQIWKSLASIRLSFWLLGVNAVLMMVNSHCAEHEALVYQRLNTTPIWQWLGEVRGTHLVIFLSVSLLIVGLALLAVNTAACSLERLKVLLGRPTGSEKDWKSRLVSWAPTLMHLLFFLILAGHMSTFSLGSWTLHRLRQGDSLNLAGTQYQIEAIEGVPFEDEGPLLGKLKYHQLSISQNNTRQVISELHPLRLKNGNWLLFIPPKGTAKGPGQQIVDCSGETRDLRPVLMSRDTEILLKEVNDPGLGLITCAFGLILLLMGVYYALLWTKKENGQTILR